VQRASLKSLAVRVLERNTAAQQQCDTTEKRCCIERFSDARVATVAAAENVSTELGAEAATQPERWGDKVPRVEVVYQQHGDGREPELTACLHCGGKKLCDCPACTFRGRTHPGQAATCTACGGEGMCWVN
jgi:hypothetical protein